MEHLKSALPRFDEMRITTIDLDTLEPCAIEVQLKKLAASAEPLEAAYWQKLLELVTHLQSDGSEKELCAFIFLKELQLSELQPPDPIRIMQMKRFVNEWRADNPDPETRGNRLSQELNRRFPTKPGVTVSMRIDWRDYTPLRDGLPEMHFRFEIKRPGTTITEDARAKDVIEAERVIRKAFG